MSERAVYWRGVVERQPGSGLTIAEFCEREGVSTASFYNWRRRLAESTPAQPSFVPLSVTGAAAGAWIEVVLPGAVTVRVPEGMGRQTIVDVLSAVEGTS